MVLSLGTSIPQHDQTWTPSRTWTLAGSIGKGEVLPTSVQSKLVPLAGQVQPMGPTSLSKLVPSTWHAMSMGPAFPNKPGHVSNLDTIPNMIEHDRTCLAAAAPPKAFWGHSFWIPIASWIPKPTLKPMVTPGTSYCAPVFCP